MITLKNGKLIAKISEKGAELKSLKKDDYEYIWEGNPRVWEGSAPILFPICGCLKDNKYTLNGKEYTLLQHGFAKSKLFKVESTTEKSVVFLLTDDKETYKSYPFKFEFRAIFTLLKNGLKVEYRVKNLSDGEMYFSLGAHEAYTTPEGIEDYDLYFPENETFETVPLNGMVLQKNKMLIAKNTKVLPLYDKYFIPDALVFRNIKSRSVVLRNRKTEREVKVEFPDFNYLLIWHKHAAGYICIEPWQGLPDSEDSNYDIAKKEGIITLKANKEYKNVHKVII